MKKSYRIISLIKQNLVIPFILILITSSIFSCSNEGLTNNESTNEDTLKSNYPLFLEYTENLPNKMEVKYDDNRITEMFYNTNNDRRLLYNFFYENNSLSMVKYNLSGGGERVYELEYQNGRLSNCFEYDSNDDKIYKVNFEYNGDTIKLSHYRKDFRNSPQSTYQYQYYDNLIVQNSNLIEFHHAVDYSNGSFKTSYTYDNKKSAFSMVSNREVLMMISTFQRFITPNMFYLERNLFLGNNNIISEEKFDYNSNSTINYTYQYEFETNNLPKKIVKIDDSNSEIDEQFFEY